MSTEVAVEKKEEEEETRPRFVFVILCWARESLTEDNYKHGAYPLSTGIGKIIVDFSNFICYPGGNYNMGFHPRRIRGVALTADGYECYTGSKDGTAIHWDLINQKKIHEWKAHSYGLTCVAYHSGVLATGGTDYSVILWDGTTHKKIRKFSTDRASCLTFHQHGETLLAGFQESNMILWSVETGRRVREFGSHRDSVTDAISVTDMTQLISASRDLSIKIWKKHSLRTISNDQTNALCSISLNSDETLLASCGDVINIRSYPDRELVRTFGESISYLSFHPHKPNILGVGSCNVLMVVDVHTGETIETLNTSYASSRPMVWSPDGSRLIVGSGSALWVFDLTHLL